MKAAITLLALFLLFSISVPADPSSHRWLFMNVYPENKLCIGDGELFWSADDWAGPYRIYGSPWWYVWIPARGERLIEGTGSMFCEEGVTVWQVW